MIADLDIVDETRELCTAVGVRDDGTDRVLALRHEFEFTTKFVVPIVTQIAGTWAGVPGVTIDVTFPGIGIIDGAETGRSRAGLPSI